MNDKFSMGVWCDNAGASRWGDPVRSSRSLGEKIRSFRALGLRGIEAHDNEIPAAMARGVRKVLDAEGMSMAMYTPNFFLNKKYANGALTSHDPATRRMAVEQLRRAIDTAHVLGADVLVYWNGQDGQDTAFGKNGVDALGWLRDAFHAGLEYDADTYGADALRVAIEPKPNEPRCHMLLPTVGDALAFIYTLDPRYQSMVGVNPETAHSLMIELDYTKDLETALFHNKLFHVHLNDQEGPKYDQDLAFGSVSAKRGLEIVSCLRSNNYAGWISFDVSPLRTDGGDRRYGVIKACLANWTRLSAAADALNWTTIRKYRSAGDFSGLDAYIDGILLSRRM